MPDDQHFLYTVWSYSAKGRICSTINFGCQNWPKQVSNISRKLLFSTFRLKPRQNGRHFPDDIFKCICIDENEWISMKISLKFFLMGQITNIPVLVQILARRRLGGRPLSEPMVVRLPTHVCVTRPQWIKRVTSRYVRYHGRQTPGRYHGCLWPGDVRSPGHQQPWYWLTSPGMVGLQHEINYGITKVLRQILGPRW